MPGRARWLALLAAWLGSLAMPAPGEARQGRPNVVLVIGDDHGWPYSGFMGDPYVRTPHLDALAAGGTVFVNAHVPSSTCVPSLRSLLAGIHSAEWDAERRALASLVGPFAFRQEVTHYRTLPRELARRGYLSWQGGKMWEGTFSQAGFTHGLATAIGGFYRSVGDRFGRDGWSDGRALDPLRSFLDEAAGQPFFVWFAPMLPHAPFDAPAVLRAPYVALGLSELEVGYYANVSWLDALVGELVAELELRGLREDTLLVYLSDNGQGVTQPYPGVGHGKGTLYELGFRTPLVLNWPGRVPAGVVRSDLASALDVMPTILDYAGADPLPDRRGVSLANAVATGAPVGRDRIVARYAGTGLASSGAFVRTATWRYLAFADGREELYAIASDPYEHLDVAAEHPELLARFRDDVAAFDAQLATPPAELEAAGRLVDGDGGPIAGAELELRGRPSAGEPLRRRAVTSSRGDFRFPSLPPGSYELTASRGVSELRWGPFATRIPIRLPVGTLGSFTPLSGRAEADAGAAVTAPSARRAG